MRVSEKLQLIDRIGRELQSRFTYPEIDVFFGEFGVPKPANGTTNSRWVYSKEALRGQSTEVVLKIANELDLAGAPNLEIQTTPPKNWRGKSKFRLFISHISKDKQKATRLKECLAKYAICGFVAHEDIHPTVEWQKEIEGGLNTMDALVSMHTKGFSFSNYTQQELGFAMGEG